MDGQKKPNPGVGGKIPIVNPFIHIELFSGFNQSADEVSDSKRLMDELLNNLKLKRNVQPVAKPQRSYPPFVELTVPNLSINVLKLSKITTSRFASQNIRTIRELIEYSETDLLRFHNFGRRSLNEVIAALAELGCQLKEV